MISKALPTLCLCILFSTGYAQIKDKIKGDRYVTVKESPINSFNRIVVKDELQVSLIEGSEASVFVEADENLHEVIQFTVADSTLHFTTNKRITSAKKVSIKVTYTKTLKQIETFDDSEVSSLTSINLDELVLMNSAKVETKWRRLIS